MVTIKESRAERAYKDIYAFVVEIKTGKRYVAKLSYAKRLQRDGTHRILAIEGDRAYTKLKDKKIN
jgi:hypothetical protein